MNRKNYNNMKRKVSQWLMRYQHGDCSGNASFTDDWPESKDGSDHIECLFFYESQGLKKPCKNLYLLEYCLQAKAALDLNIKNWAEDRAKGWLGLNEWNEMCKDLGLPDWVVKAVENQKRKLYGTINKNL